jgi:hypothetical protein
MRESPQCQLTAISPHWDQSTQIGHSAVVAGISQKGHWTVNKRLHELLVSPMIENEVVDWLQKSLVFRHRKNDRDISLRLSKYMRLPAWSSRTFWQVHISLILELTVKVIISVIVVERNLFVGSPHCCSVTIA